MTIFIAEDGIPTSDAHQDRAFQAQLSKIASFRKTKLDTAVLLAQKMPLFATFPTLVKILRSD